MNIPCSSIYKSSASVLVGVNSAESLVLLPNPDFCYLVSNLHFLSKVKRSLPDDYQAHSLPIFVLSGAFTT